MGTPEVAATALLKIHSSGIAQDKWDVVACVTQPPRPFGRKRLLRPSPVHALSESLSIPVLTPEKATDKGFLEQLEDLEPDLCITAAYGCYLPKRFLETPPLGTLNIHPSLLPLYRGASPVQRSLENGDEKIGVSVLYTVKEMDAGPVLRRVEVDDDGEKGTSEVRIFGRGGGRRNRQFSICVVVSFLNPTRHSSPPHRRRFWGSSSRLGLRR